jgi:hypothetical protein
MGKINVKCDGETFETKRKKGIIGWVDNQAPIFGHSHNLKCVQWESQGKLERMLL